MSNPNDKLVLLSIQDNIATLSLNRPQVHNALNKQLMAELLKTLEHIKQDAKIRVLILQSEGRYFCAGADLNNMKAMATASLIDNKADAKQLAKLLQTLHDLPKPTMALIQGGAFGGGIGLAACCDLVLATEDAQFCFSEVKLGLVPAIISPYLSNRIHPAALRRYCLTAEKFSAQQAHACGLVHEICQSNHLNQQGLALAHQIKRNAPNALAQTKALLQSQSPVAITPKVIEQTCDLIAKVRASEEAQQCLKKF